MTAAINASTTFGASTATPAAASNIGQSATEDRFLKLLIAQMKNQDPLNPLDNAAVTSQMAQINTVQGISQLNTTMASMLSQLQGSQAMSLAGHQVLVPGNSMTLASSGNALAARAGFDLPAAADRVTVDIKDAQGRLVNTLDLGALGAGAGTFSWDGSAASGMAAAGQYSFTVNTVTSGAAATAAGLSAARVIGTSNGAQGVTLTLEGLGTRNYSDVHMVL
jgi:flagellar basal-body rod modification protein FlgD